MRTYAEEALCTTGYARSIQVLRTRIADMSPNAIFPRHSAARALYLTPRKPAVIVERLRRPLLMCRVISTCMPALESGGIS